MEPAMSNVKNTAKTREAAQVTRAEETPSVPTEVSAPAAHDPREHRPTGLRAKAEKTQDGDSLREAHRLVLESCPDLSPHRRMDHMLEHGLSRAEAVLAGVRSSMSMKDRRMYLGYVFHDASPEEAKTTFEAVTAAGVPIQDILLSTAPMDMARIGGLISDLDLYNFGRDIQGDGLQMAFVGEIYTIKGYGGASDFEDAYAQGQKWSKRVRKAAGFNA